MSNDRGDDEVLAAVNVNGHPGLSRAELHRASAGIDSERNVSTDTMSAVLGRVQSAYDLAGFVCV